MKTNVSVLLCFLLLPSLWSTSARAQPQGTPSDVALAEQLFRDAQSLMAAKKISEACAKFAESQRLAPTLGTRLNLARCHEENGQTATAWGEYVEVARLAKEANDTGRASVARERAEALEARLARVKLVLAETSSSPPSDLIIKIDGLEVRSATLGSAIPIDPGKRTIEVSATDRQTWNSTIEVKSGPSEQTVTIPPLPPADKPPPPPPPPKNQSPPSQTQRNVGLVVGAVGVVGIGVGGFFGLRALSLDDDASSACPTPQTCAPGTLANAQSDYDDGKSAATISTIAFVVGAAALATGVVLFMLAPKQQQPQQQPLVGVRF